ncbi:hypothetical protein [Acidipropionibacterium acidipropionici]|uniref:hypothetical protein n=1 Tax=Acidipropionibacterium acidipropionici TaxID=1748 RepID=UPI00110B4E41|nr:hypothetical protein [Acidipropionibacterium acidipropionici]QCV95730.1 hypothetical protein FEZ30_11120 [Acidipropionibacterium acidipropionici]
MTTYRNDEAPTTAVGASPRVTRTIRVDLRNPRLTSADVEARLRRLNGSPGAHAVVMVRAGLQPHAVCSEVSGWALASVEVESADARTANQWAAAIEWGWQPPADDGRPIT